jgi:hypothetical protein
MEDLNIKSTMKEFSAVKEEKRRPPLHRMTWKGDVWGQEFFEAVNLECG